MAIATTTLNLLYQKYSNALLQQNGYVDVTKLHTNPTDLPQITDESAKDMYIVEGFRVASKKMNALTDAIKALFGSQIITISNIIKQVNLSKKNQTA